MNLGLGEKLWWAGATQLGGLRLQLNLQPFSHLPNNISDWFHNNGSASSTGDKHAICQWANGSKAEVDNMQMILSVSNLSFQAVWKIECQRKTNFWNYLLSNTRRGFPPTEDSKCKNIINPLNATSIKNQVFLQLAYSHPCQIMLYLSSANKFCL